ARAVVPVVSGQPLQLGAPLITNLDSLKTLSAKIAAAPGRPQSKGRTPGQPQSEGRTAGQLHTAGKPAGSLLSAFEDNFRELLPVQEEILDLARQRQTRGNISAFHRGCAQEAAVQQPSVPKTGTPGNFCKALDISFESHPYLKDHALIRQKP